MYEISFDDKMQTCKPTGKAIAVISNRLKRTELSYENFRTAVGEYGCTFSPAIFSGSRKTKNFIQQQIFALDFDSGIPFCNVKSIAERYSIPILFAYKTFSYTPEHEKFRVIFALSQVVKDVHTAKIITCILMRIFQHSDKACSDPARMFFGGKGLLYVSKTETKLDVKLLLFSFADYMCEFYGEKHYTQHLRSFYKNLNVPVKGCLPVTQELEHGDFCTISSLYNEGNVHFSPDQSEIPDLASHKSRRKVTRNFDFEILFQRCRLFHDFADGSAYYYYNELFLLAANLCNIEKGKNEFLRILNSEQNKGWEAYHKRNWNTILNAIIKADYKPESCTICPHEAECHHQKNMILTAKLRKGHVRIIHQPDYVSLEEAVSHFRNNFIQSAKMHDNAIHIHTAQTGIGKTHICLEYLRNAEKPYIFAVPTYQLMQEIYRKARAMGIENIIATPELPEDLSPLLQEQLSHYYKIGAGNQALEFLRKEYQNMSPESQDHMLLKEYFSRLEKAQSFQGHIITTHARLLVMQKGVFRTHKLIVDEDIIRQAYNTDSALREDIETVIRNRLFPRNIEEYLEKLLQHKGYYYSTKRFRLSDASGILDGLSGISSNILGLLEARALYCGEEDITFIQERPLLDCKIIILSATADPEIYRSLLKGREVLYYPSKKAKYLGKVVQYMDHSYSRYCLNHTENILDKLKERIEEDTVITFKAYEEQFDTVYHFGNTEGVNCLAGKNLSVIGIPNVRDYVYGLYGMLASADVQDDVMSQYLTEHNGYEFYLHTYKDPLLRRFQLWMISSQLEQAVGRARLLRNDCVVKVFAGFPVEQAVFCEIK